MTRNSPAILPFCKHCGEYKGLGQCRNPDCRETSLSETDILNRRESKCVICGDLVSNQCVRCGLGYCNHHSQDMKESGLVSLEQHLGTCTICGEVVCEQCWIFNHLGLVTCQIHNSILKNGE